MKRLTLFKKVLIGYISCIVFIIISFIIYSNLRSYAVYYAKHTPHAEGVHPEIIEIIENAYWNTKFDEAGVYYDFDDPPALRKGSVIGFPCFARDKPFPGSNEEYYFIDNTGILYRLNGDLEVINDDSEDTDIKGENSNAEMEKIKREVHELIDPAIDAQPEPGFFNLQWLYDFLNHDRFN